MRLASTADTLTFVERLTGKRPSVNTLRAWAHRGLVARHGDARRSQYDLDEIEALMLRREMGPDLPAGPMSYDVAHKRLRRIRGSATAHACVGCGTPAEEWSYDHSDPDALEDEGGVYSLDVARYEPRCRTCHRAFDRDM